MMGQVDPSLENIGTLTTIVLAVIGFFGWIFGSAKRAFVVIMKAEIALHEAQERLIHDEFSGQLIRLDERTSLVMDNLSEIRDDIKVLIKNGDRHLEECPFLDDAIKEKNERD